jgi:hypothetical protein
MRTVRAANARTVGLPPVSSISQPVAWLCARGALGALVVLLLAGPAGASAAPPPLPAVRTEGAREVVFDAATLTGMVNPDGTEASSDTRWCFEYGVGSTSGYGLGSVPAVAQDAGSGTTPVPVNARLTGLSAGTTYRYRLVAVNDLGEGTTQSACGIQGGQQTAGAEGLFTTPIYIPPPLVVTGSASSVEQNTAMVTGTVDPEGSRTTYEFQFGVDTGYGVEIFGAAGSGTQPEPFTVTLGDLQPATTYHYRLLATNGGGTTYGADQTFTTGVYPTETLTTPSAPPLLSVPAVTFPTEPLTITLTPTVKHKKTKKATVKATRGNGKAAGSEKHHHASKRKER